MRICFISHSAGRYGAELALLELLQGLIKLGVNCLVLVPEKGPLLVELDRLNIEWRVVSYPRWSSRSKWPLFRLIRTTLMSLVMAVWVARTVTQWRCDVVYTNTSSVCVGAFAAWLAHKPHVWHLHESGHQSHKLEFEFGDHWVARLINRFSVFIIVVSCALKKDYTRYIGPDKVRLIYQSVTLRDEIEITHDVNCDKQFFQCLMVGSLHPWKGQDEAIAALSKVIFRGVDAHLLIVGDGKKHFRAALHQQIRGHGLEQYVEFVGYVENPMQYMRAADVMLICSHWEPFGRVTIEAMLAGKPVIGANSGATAELIQDGVTGLLYDSGNHDELADKIQYLCKNPEERLKLGAAARVWATDRFTQERYAKEVFDLLGEVLRKKEISSQIPSS